MANPNPVWWESVVNYIKDNTILFASFALVWKGIDKTFKYFSDSRDQELRKIVNEELSKEIRPELQRLSKSINDLTGSIATLAAKK